MSNNSEFTGTLGVEQQEGESKMVLARRLFESQEVFPFPGIDPIAYASIKASEAKYPGCGTPVDELIARYVTEGIKVVSGKEPESRNVYILPSGSSDIENDAILPRSLELSDTMNVDLKNLVLCSRGDS